MAAGRTFPTLLARPLRRFAAPGLCVCALMIQVSSLAAPSTPKDAPRETAALPITGHPPIINAPLRVPAPQPTRPRATRAHPAPLLGATLSGKPDAPAAATFNLSTKDGHLSEALRRFAATQGWKLSWEIDRDFAIQYGATFSGPFLDIVEQLARSLQSANTPIRMKAYHGNRVLRVLYATY